MMNVMFGFDDIALSELFNSVLDFSTLGFTQCLYIKLFQSYQKNSVFSILSYFKLLKRIIVSIPEFVLNMKIMYL